MRDLYKRNSQWSKLEALSTFTTTADLAYYDLSSMTMTSGSNIPALQKIRSITHPNNYYLLHIEKEEYDTHLLELDLSSTNPVITTGDPAYFWYDRELLYLYPTPSSAVVLSVWYQTNWSTDITSSTISSTSIIPFHLSDINMIIWGCIANMSIRVPDERVLMFKQEYEKALLLTELDNDRFPSTMELDPFFSRGMI